MACPTTRTGHMSKNGTAIKLGEDNVAILCKVCNLQIGDSSEVDW